VLKKYDPYLHNKKFLISLGAAVLFLFVSVVITNYAIIYATESASGPVTDVILNNIPLFDMDGIFVYGPVVFWVIILLYLVIAEPNKIPFTLKSIALFTVIRALFVSLTHIGPFPDHLQIIPSNIFGAINSGSDLFFSGHTGSPFLIALVFWNNKLLRVFAIIASVFFGMVVLMTHMHYSIDVFAAFFITYAIFHLCVAIFKKDRHIFIYGLES
jgi:hypothetical protein